VFDPKHLNQGQIREIYRQTLQQSEEAETVAWINYVRAKNARSAVEFDLERVTRTPCEESGLHANAAEKLRHIPANQGG